MCSRRSSPLKTAASTTITGSIGAASCAQLVRNVGSLGVREGFSTITMQVVHNSFLADRYHGRSLRRKLVELRISRFVERELTKNQILEHYLNVIYLGNGMNGVEAASRDLFGKHVEPAHARRGRDARRAAESAVDVHAATERAGRTSAAETSCSA